VVHHRICNPTFLITRKNFFFPMLSIKGNFAITRKRGNWLWPRIEILYPPHGVVIGNTKFSQLRRDTFVAGSKRLDFFVTDDVHGFVNGMHQIEYKNQKEYVKQIRINVINYFYTLEGIPCPDLTEVPGLLIRNGGTFEFWLETERILKWRPP